MYYTDIFISTINPGKVKVDGSRWYCWDKIENSFSELKVHGYIIFEKYYRRKNCGNEETIKEANNWGSNQLNHLKLLEEISWRSINWYGQFGILKAKRRTELMKFNQ